MKTSDNSLPIQSDEAVLQMLVHCPIFRCQGEDRYPEIAAIHVSLHNFLSNSGLLAGIIALVLASRTLLSLVAVVLVLLIVAIVVSPYVDLPASGLRAKAIVLAFFGMLLAPLVTRTLLMPLYSQFHAAIDALLPEGAKTSASILLC